MQRWLKWLGRHKQLSLVIVLCGATLARDVILTRAYPAAGLRGTYFASTDWTGPPVFTAFETDFSTSTLKARRTRFGDGPFSVEWRGYIAFHESGDHRFELVSDDASFLYVDAESVVENPGVHSPILATGQINRPAGAYPVVLRYIQSGGELALVWRMEAKDGLVKPVAADNLATRRTSLSALRGRGIVLRLGVALAVLWLAAAVWIIGGGLSRLIVWMNHEQPGWMFHPLVSVLALSFGLSVWGIRWGAWSPDEVTPWMVLDGLDRYFSKGWFNAYPPFQFYLWAVAISPVVLADRLGVVSLGSEAAALAMYLLIRGVTVLMGVGVIFATYLSGAEAFDRRSGTFASLIVAVTFPFVFYAKTANTDVPYLFWMTWSLWLFIRLWRKGQTLDYVMFGATAALAVCTKDHAYGFYTLLPLALIGRLAAQQSEGSFTQRLVRGMFDRRLWIGGVASAVVFAVAHNVLFNWTGMVDHFRFITKLSAPFAPTVHRPWQFDRDLVSMSVELIRWSFRWPLFILCVSGLAVALVSRQSRAMTLWILLPSVSYYITYLRFIGYVYDRFLLGVCIPLAILGGRFVATLLVPRHFAPLRQFGLAAAFAYSLLAAVSIDLMMTVDARYSAEAWLRSHVRHDVRVGWFGHGWYMPRLDYLDAMHLELLPEGELADRPEYLVVNTEVLGRSEPTGALLLARLQDHRLGYSEVWRGRAPLPWWAVLRYDPVFTNGRDDGTTNLDNVNPEIVILKRAAE
jgi:Dolichyl-phosphate-mannose-protein mannosyltransferase/PA14 domain